MSDFLGRLAARNGESAMPAIAPRTVSRFEASPPAIQHDAVPVMAPAEPRSLTATVPHAPAVVTERRAAEVQPQLSVPRNVGREREELRLVERAAPTRTRVERILEEVATIVTQAPVVEPRREIVREPIVASPVIPRMEKAAEPRQTALARTAMNQTPTVENEPTVIRVHIGRIDVRATTPSPERTRSRTKPDAAKPMSLDRYLGGKDRA